MICEAEIKKFKNAKDVLLWKMKTSIKGVDGSVFREFIVANLDDKINKKRDDDIANAIAQGEAKAKAESSAGSMLSRLLR